MFRRTFLSAFPALSAAITGQARDAVKPDTPGPARHAQDDWFDEAPRKHRVVFDTWMADRFAETVGFAGNWLRVNKQQYELTDADLGLVIVVRHGTAPFAFNEAMWTKYGKIFADRMSAADKVAHPNP